jgi:hypothetical protein
MNKQEIEKAIKEFEINLNLTKEELDLPMPIGAEEHIKEWIGYLELAIQCMEQQLNNGWIAVSEQLPDKGGYYLVGTQYETPRAMVYFFYTAADCGFFQIGTVN